ncbi:WD domain [Trypanosoma vivax]|nr:hypothetical protein TRVL_02218 [Trypanosoma vivax]KAH8611508.1 WD domain [Trypanosoma vivax]
MNIAEKRRQLEEIRALREMKERRISSHRECNFDVRLNSSPAAAGTQLQMSSRTEFLWKEKSTSNDMPTGVISGRAPCTLSPDVATFQLSNEVSKCDVSQLSSPECCASACKNKVLERGPLLLNADSTVRDSGHLSEEEHNVRDAAFTQDVPLPCSAVVCSVMNETNQDSSQRRDAEIVVEHAFALDSSFGVTGRCALYTTVLGSTVLSSTIETGVGCFVAVALSQSRQSMDSCIAAGDTTTTTTTALPPFALSDGLVLLWRLPNKESNGCLATVPLCFDSEICSLTYSEHSPGVLFGGAANGSIVAWNIENIMHKCQDTHGSIQQLCSSTTSPRGYSPLMLPQTVVVDDRIVYPNQQSLPFPKAHQSRVLTMEVHGHGSDHQLYSISQDGQVCEWSPSELQLPTSSREALVNGRPLGSVVSCAAFIKVAVSTVGKVFVGCLNGQVLEGRPKGPSAIEMQLITAEDGNTCHAWRLGGNGHSFRIYKDITDTLRAHSAPVVVVAAHPPHVDRRISDLLLTAAADGSCFLWCGRRHIAIKGAAAHVSCLCWSPTNSSVFVAGESNGCVTVWDLKRSSLPIASLNVHSWLGKNSRNGSCHLQSSMQVKASHKGLRICTNGPGSTIPNGFTYKRSRAGITSLAFSSDGVQLACGLEDGNACLLHLRGELVQETRMEKSKGCTLIEGCASPMAIPDVALESLSWLDLLFPDSERRL